MELEKLDMKTVNFTDENIAKIAEIFPNVVFEGKIDFDVLKQELSDNIIEGNKERYSINWSGKKEAQLTANTPTTNTLRPCKDESVDFDTTENLYIEGDNLEVLKILQESYLNKIKMIYIDPPYNTGKDFIYKDNFTKDKEEELFESGQKDEEGGRLVANLDSNGRYHSDWLSMMYPRLKLARNLLKDDGVIFISIDDNEVHNLRKICDEIFGEGNFVGEFIWKKKSGGANDSKHIAIDHEYILIFSKIINNLETYLLEYNEDNLSLYNQNDEYTSDRGPYRRMLLMQKGLSFSESLTYKITAPDGTILIPDKKSKAIWRWNKNKLEKGIKENFVEFIQDDRTKEWKIYTKQYLYVDYDGNKINRGALARSLITDIDGRQGTRELQKHFTNKLFENSKPRQLLEKLLKMAIKEEDIVLDFFSGSSTTAHSVMQLNSEDNSDRKFIMVQIPEKTNEKSEAYKSGYKNICEIGKERIRRAGKKIKEESKKSDLDIGFRVLKLDSSNMKDVYFNPKDISQDNLLDTIDNIKDNRSDLDLLFGVLIDWGVDLTLPITKENIKGKDCYFVDIDSLCACFETGLNEEFIKELASRNILRVVFRDNGFESDDVKDNLSQIFKQLNENVDIKVI